QLLANADDLQNNANDLNESLSGPLSVGCYSTLSVALLPPIIDSYLATHPGVDLDFTVGSHLDIQQRVRDGRCEVALLYDYGSVSEPFPEDMSQVVIQSMPPYVLLHARHKLAAQAKIPLH